MRPREVLKLLWDISEACGLVAEFTEGKTYADYVSQKLLRSAVERQLEIAGEALSQVLRLEPSLEARVAQARDVVAFRNRLIHGYATIAHDIVWGIVQRDAPYLRREVDALLQEEEAGGEDTAPRGADEQQ
jgi:uncharacterized protein with HEPN domain